MVIPHCGDSSEGSGHQQGTSAETQACLATQKFCSPFTFSGFLMHGGFMEPCHNGAVSK